MVAFSDIRNTGNEAQIFGEDCELILDMLNFEVLLKLPKDGGQGEVLVKQAAGQASLELKEQV